MKTFCYKCRTVLEWESFIPRSRECPKCYAAVHSCKMCQFYDKSCYNECREPSAERVTDKEKANFCDYFKLASGDAPKEENGESLLDEANSLFKD